MILTTKAKYIAVFQAVQQAIWLLFFFNEASLFQKKLVMLFIDNNSAINMTKIYQGYKRVKNIDIQYYFVKKKAKTEEFILVYILSEDNIVDLLTKILFRDVIHNFTLDLELWNLVGNKRNV